MPASRRRIAMTITAAGEDDPGAPAPPAAEPAAGAPAVTPTPTAADAAALPSTNGRFHAVMIVEGIESGDKRIWVENSITWRDLPLPLMADDKNNDAHLNSILVGNFDTIERRGTELHGWGPYLVDPDDEAASLIALIKSGELRGVSADLDDVEFEVLWPVPPEGEQVTFDPITGEPDFPPLPTEEIDGVVYEVMSFDEPITRVTESRLMGATALTFPAFQEAWIEDDSGTLALAASGEQTMARARVTGYIETDNLTAAGTAAGGDVLEHEAAPVAGREASPSRFTFPDIPPAEWFEVPETPGPMPLTILDSGQVFGHLALWGECHIGITGECVEPPPSTTSYSRFHVGEIPVAPVGRVSVGRLTFGAGGHADTKLNAASAQAHYDRTSNVAADIRAMDGAYGIWVCGAARPGLTTAQIREVMASPPSGDWRRWGRDLEMVAALCVNVPGFNTPRQLVASARAAGRQVSSAVKVRKEDGMIASLIVSHPAPPLTQPTGGGYSAEVSAKLRELLAASIGRSPAERRALLVASVHGGGS